MPSFPGPSDDDPYYKRFFILSYTFLKPFVEALLPVLIVVSYVGFIVFVIIVVLAVIQVLGSMLGILPEIPDDSTTNKQASKEKQADPPGLLQTEMTDEEALRKKRTDPASPHQAVLEKILLKIEIDILKEMQQIREAKLDELVEKK